MSAFSNFGVSSTGFTALRLWALLGVLLLPLSCELV
jgi:hypothetical protein